MREFLQQENRIYQLAGEMSGLLVGSVTIATYSSVATHWLPQVIRRFRARYPHIPVSYTHLDVYKRQTKEEDTLDGWFDSGSTHLASMKKDQGFWPADVYMEGLDQYRGWFQAALLTAVGSTGAVSYTHLDVYKRQGWMC